MDEKVIYDFFNTSTSNFRSAIETALKTLMDKRIIMYNTVIKVKDKEKNNTRLPTEVELEKIMNIEKEILKQMGYKQISNVRVSKDWKNFRLKTKNQLNKETDIEYYFTAYDITINKKYIVEERNGLVDLLLEKANRKKSKNELNQIVHSNILLNAQKRHEKGFTASRRMAKVRLDGSYVESIGQLTDLLIDINTPNIMHEIHKIKLEEDIFTPELIDELDKLFG
jgi:phosphoribosylformylglycinamidine (FGAM) synthase PurS component